MIMENNEYSGYVTEWCPNCENEIEMAWDVETRGYKAYCPACGGRLMLCDACQHLSNGTYCGGCDYCSDTDSCKHNQKPANRTDAVHRYSVTIKEELERVVDIDATSPEEAEYAVKEAYRRSEYVLDADDFTGVSFNVREVEQ